MVKVGNVSLHGSGYLLPRQRAKAKRTLKSIAKVCGVEDVYFVRTKKTLYGGFYNFKTKSIVVVEQQGKCKLPMWLVTWRFFHELTHHLHVEGGIFLAYYFKEVEFEDGTVKEYGTVDQSRVALRAERHANLKASELASEFFGLELAPPEYSKEYLQRARKDIFG